MKVTIHRGAQEIGGTCIEIESEGKRIILDVGMPLDADQNDLELPSISGGTGQDAKLLGVIISHPHLDHYGLAYKLPEDTTFLIGKAAENILDAATVFSPYGLKFKNVVHLEDNKSISLGPFSITPYLVDHSAYDSYAILVKADGRQLFYTGDLRAHGRKGSLFERLVKHPPEGVDVLLLEGTVIGREGDDREFPTEKDLEKRLVKLFTNTTGMPLVWCSGQNIDRLVTIFRACKRTGRQFIIDMYTAHILRATENKKLPQADWDGVRVFLPHFQKQRIIRNRAFDISNSYKQWRIYPNQLSKAAPKSVMLFRPSMQKDVEVADCLNGTSLIYSMWGGYLEKEQNKTFIKWLEDRKIPLYYCHTSGHASIMDLKQLRNAFTGAVVVPIHSEHGDQYEELFGNVAIKKDGECW